MSRAVPMGRFGQEGELDGALLLLASRAGSFITGATIVVDGGHMLGDRGAVRPRCRADAAPVH